MDRKSVHSLYQRTNNAIRYGNCVDCVNKSVLPKIWCTRWILNRANWLALPDWQMYLLLHQKNAIVFLWLTEMFTYSLVRVLQLCREDANMQGQAHCIALILQFNEKWENLWMREWKQCENWSSDSNTSRAFDERQIYINIYIYMAGKAYKATR